MQGEACEPQGESDSKGSSSAPLECQYCGDECGPTSKDLEAHELKCDWLPRKCQYCAMVIIQRDISRHEGKCRAKTAGGKSRAAEDSKEASKFATASQRAAKMVREQALKQLHRPNGTGAAGSTRRAGGPGSAKAPARGVEQDTKPAAVAGEDAGDDGEEEEEDPAVVGDEEIETWTVEAVVAWVTETVGLPDCAASFARVKVDGEMLLEITDDDLRSQGSATHPGLRIADPSHRKQILHALGRLRGIGSEDGTPEALRGVDEQVVSAARSDATDVVEALVGSLG